MTRITLFTLLTFVVNVYVNSQTTWERTAAGTYNWTAPCGVDKVTIELWGGGGAGGGCAGGTGGKAGGGGSGGGYVKRVDYPVVPGNTYSIRVGSGGTGVNANNGNPGQSSFFVNASTINAVGGLGGGLGNNNGSGASAVVTGNVGFTAGLSFYGGAGGNGVGGTAAGGGGSSAGTDSNGNDGSTGSAGIAVIGGGVGGNPSGVGGAPGGGGGGSLKPNPGGGTAGSAGGAGKVVLTYTINSDVDNIQDLSAAVGNTNANISFTIPGATCRTEVLVVVRKDNSIVATPTGDGSAYSANSDFGSGTAFGGGFVVAKGTSSSVLVTNLLNWETYYVKVFTRLGTDWSSGVEISFIPSVPGYYWNGGNIAANPANGGTGTWATLNAWRQPSISGAQATWAGGSTGIIKGASGVISMNGNVTASKVYVVDNGFNLTPNTTTIRNFTGDIELYSNIAFSMNDITATTSRTINFSGNVTGASMSKLVLNVNQISNNNSVLNLSANNRLIDVPLEIAEGSNAGTKGFAIINSSGGSNSFSSSATITNNTSYPLSLCANTDETLTINSTITGTSDVYFSNSTNNNLGIVLLNASSTYSGKTFLRAASTGVVRLGTNNALPSGTDVEFLNNNGSLDLNGFNQLVGSLQHSVTSGGNITNSAVSPSVLTISGTTDATAFSRVINNGTGGVALVKSGSNSQTLGGANTYANGLTINNGRIRIGVASSGTISSITSSFAGTGTLVMSGGALSSNGATARTILNLFTISGNITLGDATDNGTLTVSNTATISGATRQITTASNVVFSNATAAIADGGSGLGFTKLGTGTLDITGQATYTGLTTVSEGTLILNRVGGATIPSGNDIVINGGTLRVSRTQTINNLTLTSGTLEVVSGVVLTINGTFTGGGNIQNDGTIVLVGPSAFPGATTTIFSMNNLTINRAGGVNLDADLAISGTLTLTTGNFNIGNNTLTLNGNWLAGTVNNLKSNSDSKLILNVSGAGATNLPNFTQLHSLTINSSRSFVIQNALEIYSSLHLETGTLTIGNNSLTFSGNSLTRNTGIINATSVSSEIIFANSSLLDIPEGLFLFFSVKTLTMNSDASIRLNDQLEVQTDLKFNKGVINLNGYMLTITGTISSYVSGGIDGSTASSELDLFNSAPLSLPDGLFVAPIANISLGNQRVTSLGDFEVTEAINLVSNNPNATDGLLDMVQSYGGYANTRSSNSTDANNNLNSKTLTLGPNAVITGDADITGKIRRYGFVSGSDYAFGNKNMLLRFDDNGGTLPSEVMVVSTKGDEGLHVDKDGVSDFTPSTADTLIGGAAVQRMWQILRTGGTNEVRFTVRFPYLDSELNGNNEANLVTWDHHIPYAGLTPHEHGKTNINTTENWVELSGHGLFYLSQEGDATFTKYWMLSEKITVDTLWLGASGGGAGSSWTVPSNWSAGVLPSSLTKLIFDPNVYKTELSLAGTQEAGTVEIKPNGVIHGNDATLILNGGPTISGGAGTWVNQGRFNAGTSTVVFDYDGATIAGSTNFHNLTINSGAKVTVQANSTDTISGVLLNDGILEAATFANTFVFNGNNQVVPNPNGSINGFHHLTISTGSNVIELEEETTVRGNLLLQSGDFDSKGFGFNLYGDYTSNFSANVDYLNLEGAKQTINGTTVTTFGNITARGTDTLILNQNIIVDGTLDIDGSKKLFATNKIIDLNGAVPFVGGQNFVRGTSTVNYFNSSVIDLASTDYFNLNLLSGAKRKNLGRIGVHGQLTVDDCEFDVQSGTLSLFVGGENSPSIVNGGSVNLENGKLQLQSTGSPILFGAGLTGSGKISKLEQIGSAGSDLDASILITDSLVLSSGTINSNNFNLTVDTDAKVAVTSGNISQNGGWLIFKAEILPANLAVGNTLKKLEVNRTSGTVALEGDLTVSDDLLSEAGVFNIGNNKLTVKGAVSRNSGKINGSNGELSFENDNDINLPSNWYDNAFRAFSVKGLGNITLSNPLTVSHDFTLAGGNLNTNGEMLEIGTGMGQVGNVHFVESPTRSVIGPMKRWFAAANNSTEESGIFPIGTSDLNRFVQINFTGNPDGGYIVANFTPGLPPDSYANFPITYLNNQGLRRYIQNADDYGYWEITPFDENGVAYAALNNHSYDLFIRMNNPASVQRGGILNDPPNVRIIRAKGDGFGGHEDWELAGTHSITQAFSAGEDYKLGSAGVVGFSWFGAGGNNENPLPIELISFNVSCLDNSKIFYWSTASEKNADYFIIQASEDGESWNEIAKIEASGNSTQTMKYNWIDNRKVVNTKYYRLAQFDFDGESEVFSPIFSSCFDALNQASTQPNPSENHFSVVFSSNKNGLGKISVKDLTGKILNTKYIQVFEGNNQFFMNENLPSGVYIIEAFFDNELVSTLRHIVK